MIIVLTSVAFLVAMFCAGVMGFAIQRGATCTVAAMDEVVDKRRFQRLLSMGEASFWVVSGLLIANALGLLGTMPAGYAITLETVAGGVLLGVGAFVNRACVFGAIARVGSGEWAYVATPIGFYAGCLSLPYLYAAPAAQRLAYGSPVLQASLWVAVVAGGVIVVRLLAALRPAEHEAEKSLATRMREGIAKHIWSPHAATTVIGISFFFMLLLVGAWSYTDVLAELARGMSRNLVARSALLVAMLAGAVVGGFTAGRFMHTPITFGQLLRCFAGGALMAWGSALIPGGNDGLILVGIPLLWPYAWLAFLAMCVSIALAKLLERRFVTADEREIPEFGH
jgi:toxin CptA